MEISTKLSKTLQKISDLTTKLNTLQPKTLLSAYRHYISPITLNLSEYSKLQTASGRTYSIAFGGFGSSKNPEASNMLLSSTDEGELTIWSLSKSRALHKANIYSADPWLMCCCFEHTEGSLLASGGMEGKLYLFKLVKKTSSLTISEHPVISIHAHDNYLSKCEFLTSIEVLTASGDKTCKLWPLEPRPDPLRVFEGHTQDVLGLSITPTNPSLFATGGCDSYVKVWDVRCKDANVWNYFWGFGHVNCVKFLKDSEQTFVAGNSGGVAKVFDVRVMREVAAFVSEFSVTEVEFSKSGRVLFVGDQGGVMRAWDVLDDRVPVQVVGVGGEGVCGIGVSPMGDLVCCASFEGGIGVFKSNYPGD